VHDPNTKVGLYSIMSLLTLFYNMVYHKKLTTRFDYLGNHLIKHDQSKTQKGTSRSIVSKNGVLEIG
jgi:hypothetical protein